jgi:metal-sulfur cluster biosynthetic enzyme
MQENNNLILQEIVKYILNTCNINIQELISNTRYYVKYLLRQIRVNNNKLVTLKRKRDDLLLDLQILENTTVKGDSYGDGGPVSFNNGLSVNTTELMGIKRVQIKEQLRDNVIERNLLMASLERNNEVIDKFIGILKNENAQIIMRMTYIDCSSNNEIAQELLYTVSAIDSCRSRSTTELENTLIDYLKKIN